MKKKLSKEKREELLREVAEIRSKLLENKDENNEKLLVYLSNIEKDIDGKKYGLVFEEHREAVDELLENNVPVLVEDESLKIDNGGTQNFLIEGDNLASLKLLEKTHKGKIDLIYIDPPYNTGKKDFIYSDKYVEKDDLFKHSKWLSFMSERLKIAHRLLFENGIIFISIDDNEQSNLKLLCDQIWGESNFLGMFSVENNPKGRKNSNFISLSNDYCLAYAKNSAKSYFIENIPKDIKDLTIDEDGNYVHNSGKRVLVGENEFNGNVEDFSSDKHYTVYYNDHDEEIVFKKETDVSTADQYLISKGYERYYSFNKKGFVMNTYSQSKLNELFLENALDFKNGKIYEKNFSTKIRIKSLITNRKYKAVINNVPVDYEIDVKTTSAKTALKELFETKESPFSNPKNVGLLKLLFTLIDQKDITILDFFAGSGTTGHAVMKLNAEDGGKRKFILCTNNENNICRDVTYERIKRVIKKEGYKASLKYYKVDFVPVSEQVYYEYADKLLLHIKELVELENGLDFDGNKKVAICLMDEELTSFVNTLGDKTTYKAVYVGHDVFVSPDAEEKLITLSVKINRIPDYYYSELRG